MKRPLLRWRPRRYSLVAAVLLAASPSSVAAAEPPASNPELVVQTGHSAGIARLAVNPSGKLLATGGADNLVVLWDLDSGRQLRTLRGHAESISSLAFLDEDTLISGARDGTQRYWDTVSGKCLRTLSGNANTGLFAISRRNAVMTTAHFPAGIRIRKGDTGDPTGTEIRLQGFAASMALDDAGKTLLCLSGDKRLTAWDISGTPPRQINEWPAENIAAPIALAPDGSLAAFATGGAAGVLRVLDVRGGKEKFTVPCAYAVSMAFNQDGTLLAFSAGSEPYTQVCDAKTGKIVSTCDSITSRALAFGPDGRTLLGQHDTGVQSWSVATGSLLRAFEGSGSSLSAVQFSPDGHTLAALSGSVNLWDARTATLIRRLPDGGPIRFSPDGKLLATYSVDEGLSSWANGRIRLRSLESGKVSREIPGIFGLRNIAFSPDGGQLLVLCHDQKTQKGLICAVSLQTGLETKRWELGEQAFGGALSPDGKRYAAFVNGKEKTQLVLVDMPSGSRRALEGLPLFIVFPGEQHRVAWSADGKFVAIDNGRQVRVYDAARATVPRDLSAGALHGFESGGNVLAGAALAAQDALSGKVVRSFGTESPVTAADTSANGRVLAVGLQDGTLQLWNAQTGTRAATLHAADGVEISNRNLGMSLSSPAEKNYAAYGLARLAVTPDGYYLADKAALNNVAFRLGDRAYGFDQFDLRFNRPDKVLEKLDELWPGEISPQLISAYRQLHRQRLARLGLGEAQLEQATRAPEIAITSPALPASTPDATLKLAVRATSFDAPLARLRLLVNGVPLPDSRGQAIEPKKEVALPLQIPLTPGRNQIAVSSVDAHGSESLARTFVVNCEAPAPKPDLWVVAVGVSRYAQPGWDLEYPAKDAQNFIEFWGGAPARAPETPAPPVEANAGSFQFPAMDFSIETFRRSVLRDKIRAGFDKVHALPVLNRDATRANILKIREFLGACKPNDKVMVLFAGHGLLDAKQDYYFAPTDMDFAHPEANGVGYDEMQNLLDGIPARSRLLLMDSCHAGEVDREADPAPGSAPAPALAPGVKTAPARGQRGIVIEAVAPQVAAPVHDALLQEQFADLRRDGVTVIAAAGGRQFAFEGAKWNNGVFTYSVLRGLAELNDISAFAPGPAADLNNDGTVRVSELRDYVTRQVTELTNGLQRPVIRRENPANDFQLF